MNSTKKFELFDTDYVLIKDGKPVEDLDIVYGEESLVALINDGFSLDAGEQLVKMTELPEELQNKYLQYMYANSIAYTKKTPLTAIESQIMTHIVKAHAKFTQLTITHPNETLDWVNGIHKLQSLLGLRVLRREFPQTFSTINNNAKENDK